MKMFIIICGWLCLVQSTFSQCFVEGSVNDEEGHPLAGANVFVPELNKGTITDHQGHYRLAGLPSGMQRIQFSFLGYSNVIRTVHLTEQGLKLNVSLELTPVETEEIVITSGFSATQHENAVKIDLLKIRPELLASAPGLSQALTRIPGVDMISKGSGVTKPVIRGLSMNDILVLNNGVRFENYQYSSHHPLGIDEFGIEDVEVIKGPASLLYGSDAIGGVLNFIKEKPAPVGSLSGDYNLQLFSNTLGINSNLGIKGATENFYGGVRAGYKSHADFLQGGGSFTPNSRFNEYSVKLNTGYTGKKGTFRIYYDHNRQNLGLVEEEAIEEISVRGRFPELFYQQLTTNLLSCQNRLYLGNLRLEMDAAWQNTELIHFGEPGEYEIQMNLGTLTYESKLLFPVHENSQIILGVQGLYQENRNLNNRETLLLPDANIQSYSVFGLMQHHFIRRLKVQAGIRYDYKMLHTQDAGNPDSSDYRISLQKQYGSFSGSLGFTWFLLQDLLLRANVAAAFRTPTLAELTSNGPHEAIYELGDQDLVPEKSSEGDLSMHYHKKNFTFDLAIFYNRIRQYIYLSPTGLTDDSGLPVYQYQQDNSVLYGGESGLHFHPQHWEWLHLKASYSRVVGKQDNGDYLPFIPADKLSLECRLSRDKLFFFNNVFFSSQLRTAFHQNKPAPEESATPGYNLLDVSIGGGIPLQESNLLLIFSINNLLDKVYIDHLSTLKEVEMNDPGRNFMFTLRIPFGIKAKSEKK